MGLTFSGLPPHPPIVVPAVGRDRGEACRRTTDACRSLAAELVASRPERVILVSPHSPRQVGAFGWWGGARLRGDLGRFGARESGVDLPVDHEYLVALRANTSQLGLRTWSIRERDLDHGAVVPLWFLCEAGWRGPTTVLSLPWPEEDEGRCDRELTLFGRAVADSAEQLAGAYSLVASGDMTHRGSRDAPGGYHPRGVEFDALFEELVGRGALDELGDIPVDLREHAAEDVVSSSVLVAAAHGFSPREHRVVSYERPFGVGYLVAVFHRGELTGAPDEEHFASFALLPSIARAAVRGWAEGTPYEPPPASGLLEKRAAVFVTLRQRKTGELRGCIGSLSPGTENLVAEVVDRAIAAAANDPRFPKVRREELDQLSFEVNVLEPPEAIDGPEELDPERFGVVVKDAGGRRGVLLPRIQGIDSVAQQIDIARRKAGIARGAELFLERFRTVEVHEEETG